MKKASGVLRTNLFFENFEAIADAAMRAMFIVDGRIDPTPSATYKPGSDYNAIVATRRFKAQFRKELKAANFNVWAKGRSWA